MYVFTMNFRSLTTNSQNKKILFGQAFTKMTQYAEGSLFYYAPNKVAPIIFSALFLLSGLLHFYQT